MKPNVARYPLEWLLYFPIGLLVLALICVIIFVSWPMYLTYQLGSYVLYLWSDE